MCHLQEQLDLLGKEEVIPLSDPGHSTYRHPEMCLPWRGLVVVAAIIDGTHAGSSGAAGKALPSSAHASRGMCISGASYHMSGQNPNFGRTWPRGPKHSHCDKLRKGHFIPAKQRNANEP